jgi:hypothetical protein
VLVAGLILAACLPESRHEPETSPSLTTPAAETYAPTTAIAENRRASGAVASLQADVGEPAAEASATAGTSSEESVDSATTSPTASAHTLTPTGSEAPTSTDAPTEAIASAEPPAASWSGPLDSAALPDALAGLHFAPGFAASEIFGAGRSGWAVELAYATDGDGAAVGSRMAALQQRGFRPILRLDYARGQNLPPAGDAEALRRYLDFAISAVERAGGRLRFVVIGNEPNIDEDGTDPARNSECLAGREGCQPAAYAAVYRAARAALRPLAAYALVAGVSPGTDAHPARWMGGPEYLAAVLALLRPGEVDGIALHAYGLEAEPVPGLPPEPLAYFKALVSHQLAAVDAAGHGATPLFITEMNEYTRPEPAFVHAAYGWLDGLNLQRRGDILAAAWFVYQGHGAWDAVALSRNPAVEAAFREVAGRYPSGR